MSGPSDPNDRDPNDGDPNGAGDGGVPDDNANGPVVELGTGTTGYQSLRAEQGLELIQGPQGGHHFLVRARIQNLSPGDSNRPGLASNPTTAFQIVDQDGERVDDVLPPYRVGYHQNNDDGWYQLPFGFFHTVRSDQVAGVLGSRVRLGVQVRDSRGRMAEHHVWIRAYGTIADRDAGVTDRDTGRVLP